MTVITSDHSPKCPCQDCCNRDLINPGETEQILRKDEINDPFDAMRIFFKNVEIIINNKD